MKAKILIMFVLVSIISSLLRFGQRENDIPNVESDSDYYLDMAQVFVGEKAEINQIYLRGNEHHYNRPLLPFCAGVLGHYMLNNNYAAAFSIINIIAAIFIAYLFFTIICNLYPTILFPWFPSLLFLTSFPQMDFGYHILTETIGLAFALGTCYFVYNLICKIEGKQSENDKLYAGLKDWRMYLNILLLFLIQVLSFLTRETALFVFIFLVYITIKKKLYQWKYCPLVGLIFFMLIIAKIPHSVYAHLYGTHIPHIGVNIKELTDPRYIIDTLVKLGLAFNIAWVVILPAFYFLIKGKWLSIHEFIIGWSLAALGYIAAGYLHNKLIPTGYPLRMFFSLFPLFYLLVISFLEKIFSPQRLNYIIGMFLILHVGISVFGVILDSGTVTVHNIFDLIKVI
jgi:hypothetical protein